MLGYTIDQIEAFVEEIEIAELQQRADRIEEIALGAQMTGKEISKSVKQLRSVKANRRR